MKIEFPPLRLAALNALLSLKERYGADTGLFEGPDCPYDEETVAVLKTILDVREVERIVEKQVVVTKRERGRPKKGGDLNDKDLAELDAEIKGLLESLRTMEVDSVPDTGERIQILKARASLIEAALKNRERVINAKSMSFFMQTVMSILDDLVEEEKRDEFLDRISPYREG